MSKTKSRPLDLGSTLRQFQEPVIAVECRTCGMAGTYDRLALIKRHGANITFARIRRISAMGCDRRARCVRSTFWLSEISSLAENDQSGLVATIKNHDDNSERSMEFRRVFMFIGADPHVDWLQSAVKTDDKGFILTGSPFDPATASELGREALHLETNLPNVFAIGDVRSGSTKRVAAAVGEGAAVVSLIHGALQHLNAG